MRPWLRVHGIHGLLAVEDETSHLRLPLTHRSSCVPTRCRHLVELGMRRLRRAGEGGGPATPTAGEATGGDCGALRDPNLYPNPNPHPHPN
jgi:hypothetical protein